jgi:hypothetical protein
MQSKKSMLAIVRCEIALNARNGNFSPQRAWLVQKKIV